MCEASFEKSLPRKRPPDAFRRILFFALLMHAKGACIMSTAPRFQPSNTLADYHSILDAIVNGGFVAHVPLAFGPDWDPRFGPEFGGFPTDVLYTGVRRSEDGELTVVGAAYFFDAGSYVEDENTRQGVYYGQLPSAYWLRIVISKFDGSYRVSKYRDSEVIAEARGADLHSAMLQATQVGLQADEPAIEHEHRWSGRLMLFNPTCRMSA
jgi:hypothetical protein